MIFTYSDNDFPTLVLFKAHVILAIKQKKSVYVEKKRTHTRIMDISTLYLIGI